MSKKITKSFLTFLTRAGIRLQISGPSAWTDESILKTSRIVLRSQADLLSGDYINFDAYLQHLDSVVIDDPLVSARGESCPEEIYDSMLLTYDKFRELNKSPPYPFPYENPVPRGSRHLEYFLSFLQSLGLRDRDHYLSSRSWFGRNADLQITTLQLALQGKARRIDVYSDFDEQITTLLLET
jgi:hypothetical protein